VSLRDRAGGLSGQGVLDGVSRLHPVNGATTAVGHQVRPGNPYLKGALGLAAFGAARTKDTYLQARYKRLTARRGPLKALVAIEHSIITAI
jgi:transposase